jgi:hypothetical protein
LEKGSDMSIYDLVQKENSFVISVLLLGEELGRRRQRGVIVGDQ